MRAATVGARMSRSRAARFGLHALGFARDEAAARIGAEVRERDVSRDREVEQQPGALAVLGHEKDAGVDRIGGSREARCARRAALRRLQCVDAEQRAGELGTPGADQPGKSEDLARWRSMLTSAAG